MSHEFNNHCETTVDQICWKLSILTKYYFFNEKKVKCFCKQCFLSQYCGRVGRGVLWVLQRGIFPRRRATGKGHIQVKAFAVEQTSRPIGKAPDVEINTIRWHSLFAHHSRSSTKNGGSTRGRRASDDATWNGQVCIGNESEDYERLPLVRHGILQGIPTIL